MHACALYENIYLSASKAARLICWLIWIFMKNLSKECSVQRTYTIYKSLLPSGEKPRTIILMYFLPPCAMMTTFEVKMYFFASFFERFITYNRFTPNSRPGLQRRTVLMAKQEVWVCSCHEDIGVPVFLFAKTKCSKFDSHIAMMYPWLKFL